MNVFLVLSNYKNMVRFPNENWDDYIIMDNSYTKYLNMLFSEDGINTMSEITGIKMEDGTYLFDEFKDILTTE